MRRPSTVQVIVRRSGHGQAIWTPGRKGFAGGSDEPGGSSGGLPGGCGASGGDWKQVDLEDLARDALAGWETRSSWPLSLSPLRSAAEFALIVCYGIFGYLVLRTVRSRRRVEAFVLVVLASALFQALFGMVEVFSGHEHLLGRPKRFNLGSVTGTYVNRNHLAGLLEMSLPFAVACGVEILARSRAGLWARRSRPRW